MILSKLWSDSSKSATYNQQVQTDEHPLRSFAKAVSWRIVGTIDTMIISWLITGQIAVAVSIGSVEVVTKMILYYGHERVWNFIKWKKS